MIVKKRLKMSECKWAGVSDAVDYTGELYDAVVDQIECDLNNGDGSAIYVMLDSVPQEALESFLSEDRLIDLMKWNRTGDGRSYGKFYNQNKEAK